MSSGKGVNKLSQGVSNINLESSEDGGWEEVSRKFKGKAGNSGGRQWVQWPQQNPAPKAWGQPDTAQKLGIPNSNTSGRGGSTQSYHQRRQGIVGSRPDTKHVTGPSVVAPGHSPQNLAGRTESPQVVDEKYVEEEDNYTDNDDDDDDVYDDEDDDYLLSDGSDSDEGPQSYETMKKHRMLKKFFESFDTLTNQEINEPERQWHCPACQNGPGAIDWYKGLQPLMTHARTKGSQRVKLHRRFSEILENEIKKRGTSLVPAGEVFGHWEGLKQEIKDHDIVWPPMVMIMNTILEKDENEKWIGMGTQELLDYFKSYNAVRAKHSYGPKGHRGMSVLIFDSNSVGYAEAERLHKHFLGQDTGRSAWEAKGKTKFCPGGKLQLYGFLARKDDLDEFNRHCPGKQRLKFDISSYHEKVVIPMKQMSEENQQLLWFKNKAAKDQRQKKALEESFNIVSEKLRKTMNANRAVRERTKILQIENKEEMDYQENFFKEQIQQIHALTNEKEDRFEKLQVEERLKIEESEALASNKDELSRRAEDVTKLKQLQDEEIGKFEAERELLIQSYETNKMEMKKRHWEEEVKLEKDFGAAYTKLMEKFAPRPTEPSAGNA